MKTVQYGEYTLSVNKGRNLDVHCIKITVFILL